MPLALVAFLGSALGILFYFGISPPTAPITQSSANWSEIAYVGNITDMNLSSRTVKMDAETESPNLKTVPIQFKYDRKTDLFYTIDDSREDTLYGQRVARINPSNMHIGARIALQKSGIAPSGLYARRVTMLTP